MGFPSSFSSELAGAKAKAPGVPYNFKHALACALTMLLFSKPLLGKLDRLITKYGMMNTRLEA